MEKYSVVVHGDRECYEVSIASESNLEWAKQSWGWLGIEKILVKSGRDAKEEEWNKILKMAQKMCDGLNAH